MKHKKSVASLNYMEVSAGGNEESICHWRLQLECSTNKEMQVMLESFFFFPLLEALIIQFKF